MKGPVIVLRGSCLLRICHYICLNDEKGSFSRLFCMIVEGNNNMIDANKVCRGFVDAVKCLSFLILTNKIHPLLPYGVQLMVNHRV